MNLVRMEKGCFLAVSHFPVSIWQLQHNDQFFAHVSCPGCTTELENENRIIFLLGHADKWELAQLISEYRRLTRKTTEPGMAIRLRLEAMQAQTEGDFSRAAYKMKLALNEVKR